MGDTGGESRCAIIIISIIIVAIAFCYCHLAPSACCSNVVLVVVVVGVMKFKNMLRWENEKYD